MAPSARSRALLARLNEVNHDLEMPELPPTLRAAGDAGFVSPHVATLSGLGVSGSDSHVQGETVDLNSFLRQVLRAAVLITRLSSKPAETAKATSHAPER